MADSFHTKIKKLKRSAFSIAFGAEQVGSSATVFCGQLPAEPARLQLFFNVAVAGGLCRHRSGLRCCLHLLFFIIIRSHSRTCRRYL
ncbi:hypothetical protein [Methanimicrococcus hongohii]|uniref:hypothetical protein n=1 Tax=Methanimicrococcus hongohii TaxID=3028295 RepID=UPI00292E9430|nr:hypothetical protein [Methanimicrococcus sp. Hf6]